MKYPVIDDFLSKTEQMRLDVLDEKVMNDEKLSKSEQKEYDKLKAKYDRFEEARSEY